jgi:hypothetical protein
VRHAVAVLVGCVVVSIAGAAGAHARSISSSRWLWRDAEADVVVSLPATALAELVVGVGLEAGAIGPNELSRMRWLARQRVQERFRARQAEGTCTTAAEEARAVGDAYLVALVVRCPEPAHAGVRIEIDPFPELGVGHTHLAHLEIGERSIDAALGRVRPVLEVAAEGGARAASWQATMASYLGDGIVHTATGYDHLAFLAMLLATVWWSARTRRELVRRLLWVATAFTLGHSVTLALAALGTVRPPVNTVELLIAVSVLVLALEGGILVLRPAPAARLLVIVPLLLPVSGLAGGLAHPLEPLFGIALLSSGYLAWRRRARSPEWLPGAVAVAFGSIHGFGFASVLLEAGVGPGSLGLALLSFNLGVEIAQAALLAAAVLLLAVGARSLERRRALVVQLGTLTTFLTACYWIGVRAA